MVTSFIYAIAIVVFGFLFYLADIFIITKSGLELSSVTVDQISGSNA